MFHELPVDAWNHRQYQTLYRLLLPYAVSPHNILDGFLETASFSETTYNETSFITSQVNW